MDSTTGYMQMGSMPAAAGAPARGPVSSPWLDADLKQAFAASFIEVSGACITLTHRHRRPWGTS